MPISSVIVNISFLFQTIDTINHLLRLSASLQLRERIKDLAYGRLGQQCATSNHYDGPISPTVSFANDEMRAREAGRGSMHLTLRMPVGCFVPTHTSSKKNVLDSIHSEWKRIQSLSREMRDGTIRGTAPLVDVLVLGASVVSSALEFIYNALGHDKSSYVNTSLITPNNTETNSMKVNQVESIIQTIVKTPFKNKDDQSSSEVGLRRRKLRFLNSMDPSAFTDVTSDLSPRTTCVISLDIDEEYEEECQHMTMAVRNWLVADHTSEAANIVKKQMYLVSTKERIKNTTPRNTFIIPNHSSCEAFVTFSAAGLLPLSVVFGWDLVSEILSGAHSLDRHFVETNPRHNLGVLLGLIDVWNDAFMNDMRGRVVKPCLHEMRCYSRFVATLERTVLSGRNSGDWSLKNSDRHCPMPVVDGFISHNVLHHVTEFVTAMDPPQNDAIDNNDRRICSMLLQADALAFGNNEVSKNNGIGMFSPGSPPVIQSCDSVVSASSVMNGLNGNQAISGNQPSTLIICGNCDAFACGQLVALAEHRALVKAWLWGLDPFDSPRKTANVECTKRERLAQLYQDLAIRGALSGDDEDNPKAMVNGSTDTILNHYVSRMQRHKNKSI